MSKQYSKEELLGLIHRFERLYGRLPTNRDMRRVYSVYDEPFNRLFGSWQNAKEEYERVKGDPPTVVITQEAIDRITKGLTKAYPTTLVIPDGHVSPDQDLTRFANAGKLIVQRRPDRIVSLGDFVTIESLSNWDLNKSANMEGKRYTLDMDAGKEALRLLLAPLKKLQAQQKFVGAEVYSPKLIFIKGNHCCRLDRYLETRPELKEHLNLDKDLDLKGFGFTDIIEYRDSIEFEGVIFTHAPMNAANQPVSGKYAIHRAAEMTAKSIVFGHTHRLEQVNYYRHGSGGINPDLDGRRIF